jgi:hypothetical protein
VVAGVDVRVDHEHGLVEERCSQVHHTRNLSFVVTAQPLEHRVQLWEVVALTAHVINAIEVWTTRIPHNKVVVAPFAIWHLALETVRAASMPASLRPTAPTAMVSFQQRGHRHLGGVSPFPFERGARVDPKAHRPVLVDGFLDRVEAEVSSCEAIATRPADQLEQDVIKE